VVKFDPRDAGATATSLIGEATSPEIPYCLKVSEVACERGEGADAKTNGVVMIAMPTKPGTAAVNVSLLLRKLVDQKVRSR